MAAVDSEKESHVSSIGNRGLVLVYSGVPTANVEEWARELGELASVASCTDLHLVAAPIDTLVVVVWSSSESWEIAGKRPDLSQVLLPSTRVVGILIDKDKSSVLAGLEESFSQLSWLREVSDMVVVSSDSDVVVELASTMALAAS